MTVTVPYGRPIPQKSQSMQNTVIERVENIIGLRVTEVNITVEDVFPQR